MAPRCDAYHEPLTSRNFTTGLTVPETAGTVQSVSDPVLSLKGDRHMVRTFALALIALIGAMALGIAEAAAGMDVEAADTPADAPEPAPGWVPFSPPPADDPALNDPRPPLVPLVLDPPATVIPDAPIPPPPATVIPPAEIPGPPAPFAEQPDGGQR